MSKPQKQKGHILRNILTGLTVNVPLIGTFALFKSAVVSMDQAVLGIKLASEPVVNGVTGGLPDIINPGHYIPFLYQFPGVGILVLGLYLYFSGVLFNTWLGKKVHSIIDTIMGRFPLIGRAYDFLKSLMEQVNSKKDQTVKKPVMVEYPCKGSWAPAFDLGESTISCEYNSDGTIIPLRSIYVPTSPNPTSGFVLNMREELVRDAEVLTDIHMSYILSCGISMPETPAFKLQIESEGTGEIVETEGLLHVDRSKSAVDKRAKTYKK